MDNIAISVATVYQCNYLRSADFAVKSYQDEQIWDRWLIHSKKIVSWLSNGKYDKIKVFILVIDEDNVLKLSKILQIEHIYRWIIKKQSFYCKVICFADMQAD